MQTAQDPLGVRAGARFVIDRSQDVSLDPAAIERIAMAIAAQPQVSPEVAAWRRVHLGERELEPDELANYVLVLDALNFFFWGHPRWRVNVDGTDLDGYWALTAVLARALDEGFPITDAHYLANIPSRDVALILRGESVIPMFAARVHNLREAGQALDRECDGRFLRCIESADGSTADLLRRIITLFPSFVDVGRYDGRSIPIYKRAQILVSDLCGAFAGLDDLRGIDPTPLTAFADYKVPQVLQQLGTLRYSPALIDTLRRQALIPAGAPQEIEIRAGTIAAVERIATEVRRLGREISDYEVDWYLWDLGQSTSADALPYHRTPTVAY